MTPENSANDAESTGVTDPIDAQRAFWNQWNAMFVENQRGLTSQRQAAEVFRWLSEMGRADLDILEVGCGSGWMASRLRSFGRVTAIDLADDVLAVSQHKWPEIRFVSGDFMALEIPTASQDVVVTLEVLAHVADQPAFFRKIAQTLRPGGLLMIAAQNRFVLERWENVAPRSHGQIRRWVNTAELCKLMSQELNVVEIFTVFPFAHGGILRIVNSPKLNRLASMVVPQATLDRWKEKRGLGHTIMGLARKS